MQCFVCCLGDTSTVLWLQVELVDGVGLFLRSIGAAAVLVLLAAAARAEIVAAGLGRIVL
jgi:hypothetical protein